MVDAYVTYPALFFFVTMLLALASFCIDRSK